MTATTTERPQVDAARILAAVLRSTAPKLALPAIASNNDLTLPELQTLLRRHGYPDKQRMQAACKRLLAGDPEPAAAAAETSVRRDPFVTALPVADLFADPTYQRELDERRVQRMASAFDPALLGIVEVSQRADGRYALLDGQHRWAAYRDYAFDRVESPHIAARVHTGLTVAEEADLYHRLNTTRKQLTGWDRWLARRGAGDEAVREIEEIAARRGYTIGMQASPGVIRATRACENVVSLGGLALLDNTLAVLRAAYGDDQAGVDAAIVHGVAHVLHAYTRDELDTARLVSALAGIVPRQLTARAAAGREVHKGTMDRLTAHVVVERYNAEPGRKVEPFLVRVKPTTKAKETAAARRNDAIRQWAAREGHEVPARGRIPKTVRAAYDAAHPAPEETP